MPLEAVVPDPAIRAAAVAIGLLFMSLIGAAVHAMSDLSGVDDVGDNWLAVGALTVNTIVFGYFLFDIAQMRQTIRQALLAELEDAFVENPSLLTVVSCDPAQASIDAALYRSGYSEAPPQAEMLTSHDVRQLEQIATAVESLIRGFRAPTLPFLSAPGRLERNKTKSELKFWLQILQSVALVHVAAREVHLLEGVADHASTRASQPEKVRAAEVLLGKAKDALPPNRTSEDLPFWAPFLQSDSITWLQTRLAHIGAEPSRMPFLLDTLPPRMNHARDHAGWPEGGLRAIDLHIAVVHGVAVSPSTAGRADSETIRSTHFFRSAAAHSELRRWVQRPDSQPPYRVAREVLEDALASESGPAGFFSHEGETIQSEALLRETAALAAFATLGETNGISKLETVARCWVILGSADSRTRLRSFPTTILTAALAIYTTSLHRRSAEFDESHPDGRYLDGLVEHPECPEIWRAAFRRYIRDSGRSSSARGENVSQAARQADESVLAAVDHLNQIADMVQSKSGDDIAHDTHGSDRDRGWALAQSFSRQHRLLRPEHRGSELYSPTFRLGPCYMRTTSSEEGRSSQARENELLMRLPAFVAPALLDFGDTDGIAWQLTAEGPPSLADLWGSLSSTERNDAVTEACNTLDRLHQAKLPSWLRHRWTLETIDNDNATKLHVLPIDRVIAMLDRRTGEIPEIRHIADDVIARLKEVVGEAHPRQELDLCAVHGDFWPGNILYNGREAFLIDFGWWRPGLPADEIAVALWFSSHDARQFGHRFDGFLSAIYACRPGWFTNSSKADILLAETADVAARLARPAEDQRRRFIRRLSDIAEGRCLVDLYWPTGLSQ